MSNDNRFESPPRLYLSRWGIKKMDTVWLDLIVATRMLRQATYGNRFVIMSGLQDMTLEHPFMYDEGKTGQIFRFIPDVRFKDSDQLIGKHVFKYVEKFIVRESQYSIETLDYYGWPKDQKDDGLCGSILFMMDETNIFLLRVTGDIPAPQRDIMAIAYSRMNHGYALSVTTTSLPEFHMILHECLLVGRDSDDLWNFIQDFCNVPYYKSYRQRYARGTVQTYVPPTEDTDDYNKGYHLDWEFDNAIYWPATV